MSETLYTIGYSCHTIDSFVAVLNRYNIYAVADVRSKPYSRFKPEFNRNVLEKLLKTKGIYYVFLGRECGARIEAPDCYIHGRADYGLIEKNELFKEGLNRIIRGLRKMTITLMCAEKDPIACHRTILICKNIKNHNIPIKHILSDSSIESHEFAEERLLKECKLFENDMFFNKKERLDLAYRIRGKEIGYVEGDQYPNTRA